MRKVLDEKEGELKERREEVEENESVIKRYVRCKYLTSPPHVSEKTALSEDM